MNTPVKFAAVLAAAALVMGPLSSAAAGEGMEDGLDRHAKAVAASAKRELAPPVSDAEKARHALVLRALAESPDSGAWSTIRGREPVYLHARETALQALDKNLSIESSRGDAVKAAQAIQEARAVLDPVFTLSIDYDESETYRRAKFGKINKRDFNPVNIAGIPAATTPAVTGINFRTQAEALGVNQEIEASEDSEEGPARILNYSASLSQQLPWGPEVSVSTVTKQQKIYYRTGYYWEDGMYSSTLELNFSSGIPGLKGFGPYAPSEAAIKLAEKSKRRTDWALKKSINDVLLAADIAYWQLIKRLEDLYVTANNRHLVADLKARTERLFALRRATNYEKAEAEAEFAKVEIDVEQARNAFIDASHDLAVIIENEVDKVRSRVYLPFGYRRALGAWLDTDLGRAMASAEDNRPDFFIDRIDRDSAAISLKASRNQAQPDLTFSATASLAQSGFAYGYRDIHQSLSKLNRPDIITQTYRLTLQRPWGNVAAEAAVDQARLALHDQVVAIRDGRQTAAREIKDWLSAMAGARKRFVLAENEIGRLKTSLEGLNKRRQIGADITQSEIVQALRKLLRAELTMVSASIDNKMAESRLLAAQGTLARDYGLRTALNEIDEKRLGMLAEGGFLDFFGAPPAAP